MTKLEKLAEQLIHEIDEKISDDNIGITIILHSNDEIEYSTTVTNEQELAADLARIKIVETTSTMLN